MGLEKYKGIQGFEQIAPVLRAQEPMSAHTTFRVGGNAELFAAVRGEEDILACLAFARAAGLPYLFVGGGSNLLVRDCGLKALVICPCEGMKDIERCGDGLRTQAGAKLSALAAAALREELTGLEFASGIPGTAGGAAYMNAGAYGEELSGIFASGRILEADGSIKTYSAAEMAFAYRHSRLMEGGILLDCTLQLKPGMPEAIKEKMDDLAARRRDKQPLNYPSAGSFFKRPTGDFAGRLIEEAGLKGLRRGGAMVSEKHAGFLVNVGNATAADVLAVMEEVQQKVLARFGVLLEPEVRILPEE